jgi:DNA primase
LIDFLSLRQYDTNVVGLKSAESGIEEVVRLSKDFNIIFCFDNDEAGKKTIEKLK